MDWIYIAKEVGQAILILLAINVFSVVGLVGALFLSICVDTHREKKEAKQYQQLPNLEVFSFKNIQKEVVHINKEG